MLIGQFCETYPPTVDGVGRVMYSYCQSLNALGHRALYIAPSNPEYPCEQLQCETLQYAGVKVPKEAYRIGIPRCSRAYRKVSKTMRFDVLHAHSPFLGGREARRLAKRDNTPLVATFHSKYYDDFLKATGSKWLAKAGVWYILRFFNTCDEVWAVNNRSAEVLRSYGYKGETVIMPNGTDPYELSAEDRKRAAQQFPLREGVPVLIFTGQQNLKKNPEAVLRACARLKELSQPYQLVMVGAGPDSDKLHAMAKELGILDDIIFTGFLSDRGLLMALYERSDLMVFPSLYDNAPMVVREAAVMGTPSLLIEGSCSAEGITHGVNGYLSQNDPLLIADTIIHALKTAKTVGKEAANTIPIPWNQLILQVENRYRELIRRRGTMHET